ncbi:unnamed protein product [Rotaria sp. Silwood2]|nr:unnamed protein product [Rotaria sp. Silwood2]
MTTTASTSSNLPDKDQIRVHVQRDGLIERQRFNTRVWRQLYITVNESKRRQLIQQSATAVTSSKATMIPSKIHCW